MMNKETNLIGVVLCGGQSTRMGTDKGMIKTNNQRWVERCIELFSQLGQEVILSVNKQQYSSYTELFPSYKIVADASSISAKGPLLGILSVHDVDPNKDLFVLACDLPFMDITIMQLLYKNYTSDLIYEAYTFKNGEEYDPLCSIYTSAGLIKVKALFTQGILKKHSMKHVLDSLNTIAYPLSTEWQPYFVNVNSKEDLHTHFKR